MSSDDKLNSFLSMETINDDFFIEIVERKLSISKEQFKIRLVFIAPATGKNENYASVVYRAKINIELIETKERKFVDVIIKALFSTIKEIKEFSAFPRERLMYGDVLRSFEVILAEDDFSFGPQCLAAYSDPYEIIALEDLSSNGYKCLDRKVGVNLEQAKLVMEIIAKFHAASVILYHTSGEISPMLDRELSIPKYPKDGPISESVKRMSSVFLDAVRCLDISESCIKKIERWDPLKGMDITFSGYRPMKCGFRVLNHGDTWMNNMMFRVDDNGNTVDVKLIDYQMSYWGTPIADLFYFIISSVHDDVKVKHFDELIENYHVKLESTLKRLNYQGYIPTLKDIYEDMDDKSELVSASGIIGIMITCKYTSDKELNLGEMFSGTMSDETLKRLYMNENYMKALQVWLPFLDERGYLDIPALEPEA